MHQTKKYIDNLQEHIKSHIKENDISAKALEREAGLKESAVKNILSGRSNNPGLEVIVAIAEALNCSVDELIGRRNSTSKSTTANIGKMNQNVRWNAHLYQNCVMEVENYLKAKNLEPNNEQILLFIQEAYIYSIQDGGDKADPKFIKWFIDNYKIG